MYIMCLALVSLYNTDEEETGGTTGSGDENNLTVPESTSTILPQDPVSESEERNSLD